MKLLITAIFIFFFSLCASAQCSDINDCNQKLSQASQMVNKLLAIDDAKDKVIAAKDAELASRKSLADLDDQIIAKKQSIIDQQGALITMYEKKQGRSISILFGIIKVRF